MPLACGARDSVNIACAQDDTTPKKRLRSPVTVRGFIGGESHDSYVIRVRKGQILSVRISWRRADDNHAQFIVNESPNFGAQIEFGKESDKGKRGSGKIPKSENYYINYYIYVSLTRQRITRSGSQSNNIGAEYL